MTRSTLPSPDAVPAEALRTVVDGRWARARQETREQLAANAEMRADPDLTSAQYREWITDSLKFLTSSGRPHTGFDPSVGGQGDVGGVVAAFAMLAYGDLSLLVKAGVQWGLFGGAVQVLGTERHHEQYLRKIIDGELLGCFAMTETGHGSDVQHLHTTATYDREAGEFVVHTPYPQARKEYIGNAARDGRMAVVFAQLITGDEKPGVHAFLVPLRDSDGRALPGVQIGDDGRKAGLNGVDNGRLAFDHVRIPRENLLNRFADVAPDGTYSSSIENETARFFSMLGTLVRGRISVAGGAGAATEKALTLAVRFGERRRQFANPATGEEIAVLDYLAHQQKLLPALATTFALHFTQDDLVQRMHDIQAPGAGPVGAREQRTLEQSAAGIKAIATWHATHTIQTCREACGGAGYLEENLLPALKADTDVFTTFEGDNTVLLQLLAKELLSDYGRTIKKGNPLEIAPLLGRQLAGVLAERTGAASLTRRLPFRGIDLTDRTRRRELLAVRREDTLAAAIRNLAPAMRKGNDEFAVFNSAQDLLLTAARAHVDTLVEASFADKLVTVDDPAVRALLERVYDLHVLTVIDRERAWYLETGRLTAAESRSIRPLVNALCAELRPHARTLVDGFGVPEEWLACPMLDDEAWAPAPGRPAEPLTDQVETG
ncbi:acyl-CoA dehydrogenase family protein [Pseudonocardia alni]|jgi:acyl-CoA oxidase|uniref:acyl-CoA dehydrogenase family protein n=1 Tax=Pseudonocardia alni TaxID=33907 RepID=UPI0006CB0183|nr:MULTISPECIES: acyl-CoA dehydrogenase [Pseudonocardia]ALE79489.1 acyl-CoA oxidase [Pseudonocardia sp. AL041005-10]NWJ73149.1 acyl-CoA dehydrogenase family protein [Pseudonocardia pini]